MGEVQDGELYIKTRYYTMSREEEPKTHMAEEKHEKERQGSNGYLQY